MVLVNGLERPNSCTTAQDGANVTVSPTGASGSWLLTVKAARGILLQSNFQSNGREMRFTPNDATVGGGLGGGSGRATVVTIGTIVGR